MTTSYPSGRMGRNRNPRGAGGSGTPLFFDERENSVFGPSASGLVVVVGVVGVALVGELFCSWESMLADAGASGFGSCFKGEGDDMNGWPTCSSGVIPGLRGRGGVVRP